MELAAPVASAAIEVNFAAIEINFAAIEISFAAIVVRAAREAAEVEVRQLITEYRLNRKGIISATKMCAETDDFGVNVEAVEVEEDMKIIEAEEGIINIQENKTDIWIKIMSL